MGIVRHFQASGKGICGRGIYGFAANLKTGDERDGLTAAWHRAQSGGYNFGALVAYRPKGILVNIPRKYEVPAGSTSHKRDQFSCGEDTVEYLTMTFDLDGLVQAVSNQLDKLGLLHCGFKSASVGRAMSDEGGRRRCGNKCGGSARPTTCCHICLS